MDCAKKNAETVVGSGGFVFKCMDFSGCKAEFSSDEISRFVDEKTLALRDKLQSGEAIRVVLYFHIPFPLFYTFYWIPFGMGYR